MRAPKVVDVAVVGGGAAGRALCAALGSDPSLRGLVVASLEKDAANGRGKGPVPSSTPSMDARVVALSPTSVSFLDRIGAWSRVPVAKRHSYSRMLVEDGGAGGGTPMRFGSKGSTKGLGVIAELSAVVDALGDVMGDGGGGQGAQVHRWSGVEARYVGHDAAGATLEVAEDDKSVQSTLLRARLVVGADGPGSRVRKGAGFGLGVDQVYGQTAVVCGVDLDEASDTAFQVFLPRSGPLAVLPYTGQRAVVVWTLPDAEAKRVRALGDGELWEEIKRVVEKYKGFPRVRGVIAGSKGGFPLKVQVAGRFQCGEKRVALVGDAAHVVHPLAGQGLNLGMHDVETLADAIRDDVLVGEDVGEGEHLRRWGRQRLHANVAAAAAIHGIGEAFKSDALPVVVARKLAMAAVDRIGPLNRLVTRSAAHSGLTW